MKTLTSDRRERMAPLGLVLIGTLAFGCAAADDAEVGGRDSAPGSTPAWGMEATLVEELRIGALDGAEEEMFGSVNAIAVTASGRIVVSDRQGPILRIFAPDGSPVGTAGREGEGPGEYRAVLGLQPHPDGFAIWDPRNARVSIYDEDGVFLRSVRVESGLNTGDAFQVDTTGAFWVKATDPRQGLGWLTFAPDGTETGFVAFPDSNPEGPAFQLSAREGALRPFNVRTHATVSPLGYVVEARNDTISVRLVEDGREIRRIRHPHTPVAVGEAERRQWGEWAGFFAGGTDQSYDGIPTTKPAFHDLRTDREGRIWLRMHVEAVEGPDRMPAPDRRPPFTWREPTVFRVFEPTGEFLGRVRFPDDVRMLESRGRAVCGTTSGELRETYVVRYRIEGQ